MHWWMVYGALTLGALTITARRPGDPLGGASVLTLLWLVSVLSHLNKSGSYNQVFPIMDAIAAWGMWWIWRRDMSPWKTALILLLCVDSVSHAAFFAVGDWSHKARYAYDLQLNLVYIAQLVCVTFPGIRDILNANGAVTRNSP